MKKYFTKEVSDRVFNALRGTSFPITKVDNDFAVSQLIDIVPTYAEVLDWMINNDILITINKDSYALEVPNNPGTLEDLFDFTKALDEAIILALDLYGKE